MADYPKQVDDETVPFQGKIVEIVHIPMEVAPGKRVVYEVARRSPGTRLLIVENDQIWLTREYRQELNDYDLRLPGGKVFDTLDEYNAFLKTGQDILVPAAERAITEAREEVGVVTSTATHIHTSPSSATIEWDLMYFLIDDFALDEQQLEAGETIAVQKMSFDQAWEAALSGTMREDRSVAVLLRFLRDKVSA